MASSKQEQQVTVHEHHVAAVVTRDVRVTIDARHELDRPRTLEDNPVPVDRDEASVTGRAVDLVGVDLPFPLGPCSLGYRHRLASGPQIESLDYAEGSACREKACCAAARAGVLMPFKSRLTMNTVTLAPQ
jgi:hypothetical protein